MTDPEQYNRGELRRFGWMMALGFAGLAGVHWMFGRWGTYFSREVCGVFGVAALFFVILGVVAPQSLYWPKRIWMSFSRAMGWVVSILVLTMFYVFLLSPVALLFQLNLRIRERNRTQTSYWRPWRSTSGERDYNKPY